MGSTDEKTSIADQIAAEAWELIGGKVDHWTPDNSDCIAIIQSAIEKAYANGRDDEASVWKAAQRRAASRAAHASEDSDRGDTGKVIIHPSREVAKSDADFVFRWMGQCRDFGAITIPENIIGLQERVCDYFTNYHPKASLDTNPGEGAAKQSGAAPSTLCEVGIGVPTKHEVANVVKVHESTPTTATGDRTSPDSTSRAAHAREPWKVTEGPGGWIVLRCGDKVLFQTKKEDYRRDLNDIAHAHNATLSQRPTPAHTSEQDEEQQEGHPQEYGDSN